MSLPEETKEILTKVANTIRVLSIDAVQKAKSGHPGLPLGCAEFGAYLFGCGLRYNAKNPDWFNRDHFILSAGHGSAWLYACLHLAGYNLTLDDLKQFRQLHSKTPGHPEFGETEGVEATTGPLGQGLANAVGMALGLKLLQNRFNQEKQPILDNKVFCLAGDGCIMEGVTSEASSFAGHLGLDNLVVFYDSNHICLDGKLDECCSENTAERYKSYGWDVVHLDGYDFDAMQALFDSLREKQTKPVFVVMTTVIGKYSPAEGTSKAHGAPLGPEGVIATKKAIGFPENEDFYVPHAVKDFFHKTQEKNKDLEQNWNELFRVWSKNHPELFKEYEQMHSHYVPQDLEKTLWDLEIKSPIAGRSASHAVLAVLAQKLPQLVGGSADLSGSDKTMLEKYSIVTPHQFEGRNIKFGVREFAMSAMANGLSYLGLWTPFIGTFLTFSDYMRNAIRLAALSKIQVIYQFTHDSIFLGEDGPTHQPVEHYASLRAMPGLHVFRPGDSNEVKMSWIAALHYQGPSAILLSRQNLPMLEHTKTPYAEGVQKGAYIVKKEKKTPEYTLCATGSELSLAIEVANQLEARGKDVRVISFVCFELFDAQDSNYQKSLIGVESKYVSIEAGVDFGWYKYIGKDGIAICLDTFGLSAPDRDLANHFGFEVDLILERILS